MHIHRLPAIASLAVAVLAGSAGPALAHHAMGGETPDTLAAGLISGLAHPVIGIDHLAFVIAAGVAAAFTPNRLLAPLAFIGATVAGCLLLVAGITLPAVEIVVAASVLVIGAVVLSGRAIGTPALLGLFALAGLFHGFAYGGAIVGSEATPLLAYLVGFAAIQFAVAAAAGYLATVVWKAAGPEALRPRLVGAVVAGIGFTFVVENLESLLLV